MIGRGEMQMELLYDRGKEIFRIEDLGTHTVVCYLDE